MSLHVPLIGATADDLLAWLPECIVHACRAQALSSLRPQPSELIACHIPAEQLDRSARQLAHCYVGLYDEVPSQAQPFGVPLLLLAVGLYDTPAAPGELHVAVWCGTGFPLTAAEVVRLLAERFPSRTATPAAFVPPAAPREQPAEAGYRRVLEGAAQAAPLTRAEIRRGGLRPATRWLIEQLAPLPDPLDPEPFYQGWMAQYRASEGRYPRYSVRSFDRSIDAAFKELGRTHRG